MIPKYIFEDDDDSALSSLFQASYTRLYQSGHLLFAGGNGGFLSTLLDLAGTDEKEQTYVIFIDMIPDNIETERAYHKLQARIGEFSLSDRVCVLPIICAEYYFIKAFHKTDIEIDPALAERCISMKVHYDDFWMLTHNKHLKNKPFEAYCKSVLPKCFLTCVGKENNGQQRFMRENCPCSNPDCLKNLSWSILDKSSRYVANYPAAPQEVDQPNPNSDFTAYTFQELKEISRQLCTMYNQKLAEYKEYCAEHNKNREFGTGIKEV